jgi:tRNA(Met) cytidine acetyltransferase
MPDIKTLHRQLIVISDTSADCIQIAKDFTANMQVLWLSKQKIENQKTLAMSKATTLLGQEFQAIVFNVHNDTNDKIAFDANAFGAVIGTIIGGGYLLLLVPDSAQWVDKSRFIQRLLRLLRQFSIPFYNKNNLPPRTLIAPSSPQQSPLLIKEQQIVFNAMLQVMHGHRRRPLVLTSDRGRGKSTLLGKLAAHLLRQGRQNIIITAPSRKIAETLFNAAASALEDLSNGIDLLEGLHFLSPDELHQQKPSADLVLVDEAASIPLPMLGDFVKQYSRLIFATTEHGYEGSGRGFAIRFRTMLNKLCPQWKSAYLEQPFRWQANDPLEKFGFAMLLLDADIANLRAIAFPVNKQQLLSATHIERISQHQLLDNEVLLREIFALLLSAHYQTRPSDLVRLLDDNNYQIFILRYKTHLLAMALIAQEGGFSKTLAEEIYNGNRRPQGHLIPQLLATHAGIKEAPCYYGDRIMRIAVHPELQGRGLGSHLLDYLVNYSMQQNKVDYIATSFGATPELVSFWHKADFNSIQISMKRDASSGTHSIVMLYPFSQPVRYLFARAYNDFKISLPLLLADPLRDLEAPLVATLYTQLVQQNKQKQLELDDNEQYALYGFAYQQRGYESSIAVIYKLTQYALSHYDQTTRLTPQELQIIIAKVLQKQNWHSLVKSTNVNGKKQAINLLRQAVQKLTRQCLKY